MQEENIDKSTQIRQGEELDAKTLTNYLNQNVNGFGGEVTITQFPGGFSNLTYLVATPQKEYVLRRPPFGANIKSAHDMSREYNVLSTLMPVYDKIPKPVIYCEDEAIIGAQFYLMERVKGIILRNKVPKDLSLPPELMKQISENVVDNLVNLHALELNDSNLINLGKPEGYTQRQVEGWIKRYRNAQTDEIPSMNELAEYLPTAIPETEEVAFIHNDYKYDNLVLNADNLAEILAVLDWEMATIGNPLMDLATSLAYWAEGNDSPALKPFSLTWLPGNLNRSEVLARYEEKSGRTATNMVYYFAFAAFKLGVIVQQIYSRFKQGKTSDPRFAGLIYVVQACGTNGINALKYNRINDFK
jgi:aminoglycoside phosphotransferase (APT) family kinase protein